MKKSILFLMGFMVLFLVATISFAMVDVKVFDNTFVRGTGTPVTETKTFPGVSGKAIIKVYNGGLEDADTERVSSSVIKINGQIIFDQSNFNQNITSLEKEIIINDGQNTLEATLKSKPGGKLTVQIMQDIGSGAINKPSLAVMLMSYVLKNGNVSDASNFVIEQWRDQFILDAAELDSEGVRELGDIIENAVPVFSGKGYSEYESVVTFSDGVNYVGKLTLIKTDQGWRFKRL